VRDAIPSFMKQYIVEQQDVRGNGNCGFRAIAIAVGKQDTFENQNLIRQWLHATLLYEGTKIYVSCVNNATMNFGNHLRRAINVLLDVTNRKAIFARQLADVGVNNAEMIRRAIHDNITIPATNFELAIARWVVKKGFEINFNSGFLLVQ
jgi:hypothetical protein